MKHRRYRDRTLLFFAASLAYVFFANISGPFGADRQELFPFFNWGLFTNFTSETRYDFAIYIEKLDQKALPEPTIVNAMKQKFRRLGDGMMLLKATRILARAIIHEDSGRILKAKNTIERLYLRGPEQVGYSVRLIKYRPLERYRNGMVTPVRVLQSFEKRN